MKRLAIFCFYDPNGVVDRYVLYLLETIKTNIDKLWIVCNGKVRLREKCKLEQYADEIYYRKNSGYDAGAYQDVLICRHNREDFQEYDELLLFNSTFYGPFVNWKFIFDKMSKQQYDCWSLSCAIDDYNGKKYRFLQSYFRVYSKSLFHNDFFWKEWQQLSFSESYKDCVMEFERGMSVRIEEAGFVCGSWLDYTGGYEIQKKNVYREYSYKELIGKYSFPIIKYKSLSVTNYINTIESMKYIDENTEYDVNMIIEHQERLAREKLASPFSEFEVKDFIQNHKKVYIYGHGLLGKGLNEYFEYNNIPMGGYVVSEKSREDEICIDDLKLDDDDGIIISVGNILAKEIVGSLLIKFNDEQLLVPR